MEEWIARMDQAVRDLHRAGPRREIDAKRLYAQVAPPSPDRFTEELANRVAAGRLKPVYRVLSQATRAGIAEYDKALDVPTEVYDRTADTHQSIVPSRDVELVFRAA